MTNHPTTDNHGFARIEEGTQEDSWGPIVNQDLVDPLERRVPVLGADPAQMTPYANGLLIESNGNVHTGDGSSWNQLGTIMQTSDVASNPHGNEAHSSEFETASQTKSRVGDRRYHTITSGSSYYYHKICDLKDPGEGTNGGGAVKVRMDFADNRGSSPIRTIELNAFAKGNSLKTEFLENGPTESSTPFQFAITEEDTGSSGNAEDYQYRLYVRTETWAAVGVEVVPGSWFGTHDFQQQTATQTADLPGTLVYDTADETPDRIMRAGTMYSNGEQVATQSYVDSNASGYSDSDAVAAINNDADHGSTAQHNYYSDSQAVSATEAAGHEDMGAWSTNGDRDLHVHGQRAMVGYDGGELIIGFGSDFDYVDVESAPLRENGDRVATRTWVNSNSSGIEASDVTSSNWGDYEIQKNGTDGSGIINFKT